MEVYHPTLLCALAHVVLPHSRDGVIAENIFTTYVTCELSVSLSVLFALYVCIVFLFCNVLNALS